MSQVFQADNVMNATNTSIPGVTEATLVTGNALNPPFGTCKASIVAQATFTVGTAQTTATLRVRRNPNQENVQVAALNLVSVTAGNIVALTIVCNDSIPDGRPVQYAVTVQQAGGAGNGTNSLAAVQTILISG